MQNRLRIWSVALLAVLAATSVDNTAWAQLTRRSAVHGRQLVRAALARAVADGTLSKTEAESIYHRGERLLTAEELPGLRRTLDRLAAGKRTLRARSPRESVEDRLTVRQSSAPTTQAGLIAPAKEKKDVAENVSYEGPAGADEGPAAIEPGPPADDDRSEPDDKLESPFKEEDVLEGTELTDDARLVFEDGYYYNAFAKMSAGFQSLDVDGWRNLGLYTTVDAFKGPLDLDDRNGNFGSSFALNAGIPVARRFGIGMQAGTSAVLTNFYGTQFTGPTIRSQNFTTVGLFQNIPFPLCSGNLKWGFTYDWLFDDYYASFTMGQWRVKLGYELDPCREIGIWASIPDRGDSVWLSHTRIINGQTVTLPSTLERFRPIAQGSLYYRRCWQSGIGTTAWVGAAEEPGEWVFGADAHIPITCRLALVGNFNYILPSASAEAGQDEEMWHLSMGIEWRPRARTNHCLCNNKYAPLLPLANNGTFAIRRF